MKDGTVSIRAKEIRVGEPVAVAQYEVAPEFRTEGDSFELTFEDVGEHGDGDVDLIQCLGVTSLPMPPMLRLTLPTLPSLPLVPEALEERPRMTPGDTVVHDEKVTQEAFLAEMRGLLEGLRRRVEGKR